MKPCPTKAPFIAPVYWNLPLPGWIRVILMKQRMVLQVQLVEVVFFKNNQGIVCGCFTIPLGITQSFESELVAAIKQLKGFDWGKVWLACDLSFVVHLFSSKSLMVPWSLRANQANCHNFVASINLEFRIFFKKVIRLQIFYQRQQHINYQF